MIIFLLCVILFLISALAGGIRGIKSFAVLIYNAIVIFVSIILLGHGANAFLIMLVSSVIFLLLTIIYQNGFSKKTLSSLFSVLILILIIGALINYIALNSHISGLNEIQIEEGSIFMNYAVSIDMQSILIVGTVWASLGAVIDTSISISSALNEINENNKSLSKQELIKSGFSIGKDILGTTINTLTFVGFGESLMLIIFYYVNGYKFSEIINLKSFFSEVSIILISSISCVLIIPITAIIFSNMIKHKNKII